MNFRKLLNLGSRAIGAGRAVKRRRVGAWAQRQVIYVVAGKVTAAATRRIR